MRLTIRNSDGTVSQPMNLDWSAALEKLAAYEDAEEQRRLVILPCKVGDTVYWCPDLNDRTWILSAEVTEIYVCHGGQLRFFLPDLDIEPIVPNAHLFFSREDAEAALKGGQDDGTS